MQFLASSLICAFCTSSFTLSAVIQQRPSDLAPQWTYGPIGVYRFVNFATGTALSANGTEDGAAIVSMPVVQNDNAQIWHMIDVTRGLGVSLLNNGTGKFIKGFGEGQLARAVAPIIDDWTAIWGTSPGQFGYGDGDPISIGNRVIWGNLEIEGAVSTPGAPVVLARPTYHGEHPSQDWYAQYLGP